MKRRREKLVAIIKDEGQRQFTARVDHFDSINQAKRANGLNSATCRKFPPTVDQLHEEALEMDAEMSKLAAYALAPECGAFTRLRTGRASASRG